MALIADLRYAVRLLTRQRAFSFLIVITLALGIGATSAMFSVINGVLLRPLPYSAPERIVRAFWPSEEGRQGDGTAPANYLDLKRQTPAFQAVAGYTASLPLDLASGDGDAERTGGAQVTEGFFEVFGVPALRGRTFDPAGVASERGQAAVISYGLWRRRFGSRDDIIDQTLLVNGRKQTIVGVMPERFDWPQGVEVWLLAPMVVPDCPIAFEGDLLSHRDLGYFQTVARLARGVTIDAAQANAENVMRAVRVRETGPGAKKGVLLVALKESLVGDSRAALLVLLGAVGLVLLIACANVANLLLAKATNRHREMAVRTALGAPRARLVRQLLVESLVLAVIGGLLGLLVAQWGASALLALAPKDIPRLAEVRVDWSVVSFTTIVCLVTGLLFGLAPALQSSRVTPQDVLRDASARTVGTSGAHVTRSTLVVLQMALALMLVTGAALMVTSLSRLQAVDPGFKTEQVITASLPLPATRYPTPTSQWQFYEQVIERPHATPVGASATLVFPMPLRARNASATFQIDGRRTAPGQTQPSAALSAVAPGYFRALSVPFVRGRDFTLQDSEKAPAVAIVNSTFARKHWRTDDAVGKRLDFGDAPSDTDTNKVTIIGIVGDIKGHGLDQAAPPTIYFPFQQFTVPYVSLVLRTTAQPGDVATAIRGVVRQLDPQLPVDAVERLDVTVGETIAQPRFRTLLLATFAGTALLLALVGVYGVISYAVSQRRRELGVRAAMGATPFDLLTLVMKQGLTLTAIGAATGLVGAFVFGRLLNSLLYGVAATDPLTLAASTLTLLIVAAVACALPARRAMRQDPLTALRDE
jgi:predicted permease